MKSKNKKRSSPHSGSISDFWLPSKYYLPKNRGGKTYFAPFKVRLRGHHPLALPKSTPMHIYYINYFTYTFAGQLPKETILSTANTLSSSCVIVAKTVFAALLRCRFELKWVITPCCRWSPLNTSLISCKTSIQTMIVIKAYDEFAYTVTVRLV